MQALCCLPQALPQHACSCGAHPLINMPQANRAPSECRSEVRRWQSVAPGHLLGRLREGKLCRRSQVPALQSTAGTRPASGMALPPDGWHCRLMGLGPAAQSVSDRAIPAGPTPSRQCGTDSGAAAPYCATCDAKNVKKCAGGVRAGQGRRSLPPCGS